MSQKVTSHKVRDGSKGNSCGLKTTTNERRIDLLMSKVKSRLKSVLKHKQGKASKEEVQAVMADPVVRNVVIENLQSYRASERGAKRRTKSTTSNVSEMEKPVN